MASASRAPSRPVTVHFPPSAHPQNPHREVHASSSSSKSKSSKVAHTLTACVRCRQRKTRCDPTLPRCGPCERTNSVCEYWDAAKGHTVNRNYVVYLQHKVRELELELESVENEDGVEDPEAMMRAAGVKVHEADESKFLGPSSGIAITRLVMQLAKQFTDATSIKDIVPDQQAKHIKELYHQEQAKPTSKVYPLISDVAAVELPNRPLTGLLVQLYELKVQPMYPALHEPTLEKDVEAVYALGDGASPYQQFVTRMVIAISLQKLDTQYAGLADSYYLAALKYLEPVVKPMDMKTLQCFALMAEYSLLTPTRTAIYYVVGIAVRLSQALGYSEEKTVVRPRPDGTKDYLEIDMRRRLFWCIFVMDCGLAHSLGRPTMMATRQEHLDVEWFSGADDEFITPGGVDPVATNPSMKKWIAIHFFKMRLLQLQIRRKLYLRKRPSPCSNADPWFNHMEVKLVAWRDASPAAQEGFGLDKVWFIGRFNTMIVFLYRPSPQVPRPSLEAALKCFDACEYNIYMQREQIRKRNVDLSWIFTQAIFMAINTMLWSLSYDEVRRKHSREAVEGHLAVAMEAIQLAADRWPGVASAVHLYQNLIGAILKIYEKDGDVPISAVSPSDGASPAVAFHDQAPQPPSPATVSSSSVATPPGGAPPFGYIQQQASRGLEQSAAMAQSTNTTSMPFVQQDTRFGFPPITQPSGTDFLGAQSLPQDPPQQQDENDFNPYTQFNALPEFTPNLTVPGWNFAQPHFAPSTAIHQPHFYHNNNTEPNDPFANPLFDPTNPAYPFPSNLDGSIMTDDPYAQPQQQQAQQQQQQQQQDWDMDDGMFGSGLTQLQQEELMQSLETDGMEDIQSMISATNRALGVKARAG